MAPAIVACAQFGVGDAHSIRHNPRRWTLLRRRPRRVALVDYLHLGRELVAARESCADLVTLAGRLFWRQAVTRTFIVAMVIAIAGTFVLVGPNFAVGGTKLMGDALGAPAGVFYAGYLLSIKWRAMRKLQPPDSWRGARRSRQWCCYPSRCFRRRLFFRNRRTDGGCWLGSRSSHRSGLIAYAFAHLSASLSSLSLLIQPVMAVMFAWILFGEALAPLQLIGGAIVLAGIWLARRGS